MSEEKKKNKKVIGLSIGICAALLLIVTGTYAYWTITKSQNDPNSIVAACLDITTNTTTSIPILIPIILFLFFFSSLIIALLCYYKCTPPDLLVK